MAITRITKKDIPLIVSGEIEYMKYHNSWKADDDCYSDDDMFAKAALLEKSLTAEFARKDRVLKGFIAKVGGEFAGCLLYNVGWDPYETEDRVIYGLSLVVPEKFRGTAIAARLLQRLKKEAENSGCREIHFVTSKKNGRAVRLYEKIGVVPAASPDAIWLKFNI